MSTNMRLVRDESTMESVFVVDDGHNAKGEAVTYITTHGRNLTRRVRDTRHGVSLTMHEIEMIWHWAKANQENNK